MPIYALVSMSGMVIVCSVLFCIYLVFCLIISKQSYIVIRNIIHIVYN